MTTTQQPAPVDRFPDATPGAGFALEEAHAIDRGAVRAYIKFGNHSTPEDWQNEGARTVSRSGTSWDPAAVVRSRAWEYAFTHPDMIHSREPWEISSHIEDRMTDAMKRALRPRKHNGREVFVTATDHGAVMERRVLRDLEGHRPTSPRYVEIVSAFPGPSDSDLERVRKGRKPRTWGGRAARTLPKPVRDEARIVFDDGGKRSSVTPDPVGERVTHRMFIDSLRTYLATGRVPHGVREVGAGIVGHAGPDLLERAEIPDKGDQRHRIPTRMEFWNEVLDDKGRDEFRVQIAGSFAAGICSCTECAS
ncbi:hypothetical protein ACTXJ9_14055 [Brachybacterium tyrofermentans]|uniref:hypothetical protein n=1 Tax=Brachybacterium tyrofermentans TaxID=47848 RepID=UPI003FD25209